MRFLSISAVCGFVVACVAWIYWPALRNGYVWDDLSLFVLSDALRKPDQWWVGITQPILPGTTYFRPLVLATFVTEFHFGEPDPRLSHLVNLALHLLNVGLVLTAAYRFVQPTIAVHSSSQKGVYLPLVVCALFYGLHPALIEDVVWVASRFDLMATAFALLYVNVAMLPGWGWRKGSALGILFFLGLLSKEMVVTVPILTLALLGLNEPRAESTWRERLRNMVHRRDALWMLGGAVVSVVAYILIKRALLGATYHLDQSVEFQWTGWHRLSLIGESLTFYIRMLLWPFMDISPQHPLAIAEKGIVELVVMAVVALAALACAASVILVTNVWIRSLAIFIFSLLPVLNIVPLTIGGNVGHDRFLCLPLAIFALLLARPLVLLQERSKLRGSVGHTRLIICVVGCTWLALSAVNIRVTVPLWKTEVSLWMWASQKYGDFPFVRINYVNALLAAGDVGKAEVEAAKPVSMRYENPLYDFQIKLSRGMIKLRRGQIQEAWDILKDMQAPSERLMADLRAQGVPVKQVHLPKVSRLGMVTDVMLYNVRAEVLIGLRRYSEALEEVDKAAFVNPESQASGLLRSFALYGLGRDAEADTVFNEVKRSMLGRTGQDAERLRKQLMSQLCAGQTSSSMKPCAHDSIRLN